MAPKKKSKWFGGQQSVQHAEIYDPATRTSSLQPVGQQPSAERTHEVVHGRQEQHPIQGGSSSPQDLPIGANPGLQEHGAAGSRLMAPAEVAASATGAHEPADAEEWQPVAGADTQDALELLAETAARSDLPRSRSVAAAEGLGPPPTTTTAAAAAGAWTSNRGAAAGRRRSIHGSSSI
jgi:hypothetical protein